MNEWKAYFTYHPFYWIQNDYLAGLITSSIFNSQRTDNKQKIFNPGEFILKWDTQEIKQTTPLDNDSSDFEKKANLFRLMMS